MKYRETRINMLMNRVDFLIRKIRKRVSGVDYDKMELSSLLWILDITVDEHPDFFTPAAKNRLFILNKDYRELCEELKEYNEVQS